MANNPPVEVLKYGQSIWYDNIRRDILRSGKLRRLIEEDGIRGVTSNPAIFEKAIAGSTDYDEAMAPLVDEPDPYVIYEKLALDDIRMAADLLLDVYDQTEGRDGYVSLEVSPYIADDTDETVREAIRLFEMLERPNVMIKIPATQAGIPAIAQAIAEGVNVNVTLIFSVENYSQVVEAYLKGLEMRLERGLPLHVMASVASFFVSRIDTAVDRILESMGTRGRELMGKAALAVARLAYRRFRELFASERFARLEKHGAHIQRLLWASTSTKNPAYPDLMYVEPLIGPDTVNTVPPHTLEAFKDHGKVRPTLEDESVFREAERVIADLAHLGIDIDAVTDKLQRDGVKAFADAFTRLLSCIDSKRQLIRSGAGKRQNITSGGYDNAINSALKRMASDGFGPRLWSRDPSLWKDDESARKVISSRLGWLNAPEWMAEKVADLKAFADEVKGEGITHIVLLGMGGSSLAADVLRACFGPQEGYPTLSVLDTTDPEAIAAQEAALDLRHTMFLVSSKSGTTLETISLFRYFMARMREAAGDEAGHHFVAITDPGSPLEKIADENGFRRKFLNPPDIGGRYSALSYFGMVPAALMGLDIEELIEHGREIMGASGACIPPERNPGLWLGGVIGGLYGLGRDKLTLIAPEPIQAFPAWIEQLIAESSGKEGRGILPVPERYIGAPDEYPADRLFIYLRPEGADPVTDGRVAALKDAGHPVVQLDIPSPAHLGGEFSRWEVATAAACAFIGVNPFDEPNVRESKEITASILAELEVGGDLGETPLFADESFELYARSITGTSVDDAIVAYLNQAGPNEYVAILAYMRPTPERDEALWEMQATLRKTLKRAVTVGYGPRYLHSTGQLHKGGPNNGVFLMITADTQTGLTIPDVGYDFGTLQMAQVIGDMRALKKRGRRVMRIHIRGSLDAGLRRLMHKIGGEAR